MSDTSPVRRSIAAFMVTSGPCECLAKYGAACAGVCTQEIVPAVLEGVCPVCHARLNPADGQCPDGHGYWTATIDHTGNSSYSWAADIRNPFGARRVGLTMTGVDPDVFNLLTGGAP